MATGRRECPKCHGETYYWYSFVTEVGVMRCARCKSDFPVKTPGDKTESAPQAGSGNGCRHAAPLCAAP